MANKLYFVRHGQTVWNVENKICGATESPLTELGHRQAEETAKMLLQKGIEFDEILCSPLSRAKDTAEHIATVLQVPLREDDRLFEQNFGKYEGTARDGAEFYEAKKNFVCSYEGGESMLKVAHRVYGLLDEVTSQNEKTYLLVAHNGIARIIQSYFFDMTNDEFSAFGVPNCEVLEYEF